MYLSTPQNVSKVQAELAGGTAVFWVCSVRWTAPNCILPTSKIYTQRWSAKQPLGGLRVRNAHSVNRFKEDVAQDVERHITARLDTSIDHTIASFGELQILLLNGVLIVANSYGDHR